MISLTKLKRLNKSFLKWMCIVIDVIFSIMLIAILIGGNFSLFIKGIIVLGIGIWFQNRLIKQDL